MKQLTLDELIDALGDKPASIGDRLGMLGVEEDVIDKFPEELLGTKVYGTSFLKFLADNKNKLKESAKIPANPLPADFVNAFDDGEMTLEKRLEASGLPRKTIEEMFLKETLNLELNGDEFQQFINDHRDRFIGGLQKMVGA